MATEKYLKYVGGLVIIVVVLLLGISIGRSYQIKDTKPTVLQNEVTTASLKIDLGTGDVQVISDIPVTSGGTVFDLLKLAMETNKIDVRYKDFGGELGIFIESINGVGKDLAGKRWWQYWVNGKYSQVGVTSYTVQPGDVIEFKFIDSQE